jgi:hypothetical protein
MTLERAHSMVNRPGFNERNKIGFRDDKPTSALKMQVK